MGEFISALFDFSFKRFVTPAIAAGVYILAIVGAGVFSLVIISRTANEGAPGVGLITAVFFFVGSVIAVRVGLEGIVALIRIAENTALHDDRNDS